MSSTQGQAAPLFDERAQTLRNNRAHKRQANSIPFLAARALDDLVDRLLDVNRPFEKALLIGPFDWRDALLERLPDDKIGAFDWADEPSEGRHDLIMSLLHMQSIDNLPGWMQAVRSQLVPDGLFIGGLIGGASLGELRQALYSIDTDRHGSPLPRIHPMIEIRQAAPLLSHASLALPVVDGDRFTVQYRKLETLISDLRDLGLTNSLTARQSHYEGRDFPSALAATLKDGNEETFPITWEIVWLTGWSPHESQSKPLKPGSAKMGLNTALKAIRDQESGSE